jgi:hypothetical protein
MTTDFRAELASARRLYLHWLQAGKPRAQEEYERDLHRILASYERAVDEIDRLKSFKEGS